MQKFSFIVLGFSAGIFLGTLAFAEYQEMQQPGQDREEQGARGGKEKGMKNQMMKGMHQQPSMVATADGGVIVLSGPKLAKYDGQLNLVKEVELRPSHKPMNKIGGMEAAAAQDGGYQEPMNQAADPATAEIEGAMKTQAAAQ